MKDAFSARMALKQKEAENHRRGMEQQLTSVISQLKVAGSEVRSFENGRKAAIEEHATALIQMEQFRKLAPS